MLFVFVGDAGEVWVPAEDGQSGESLETSLVHPQEWRDPLLQISCESEPVCFLLRFCCPHRKHCTNISRFCAFACTMAAAEGTSTIFTTHHCHCCQLRLKNMYINVVIEFIIRILDSNEDCCVCVYVCFGVCIQSDVIRKPQGQIELNSSCRIVRGEGAQTFQVSGKHM